MPQKVAVVVTMAVMMSMSVIVTTIAVPFGIIILMINIIHVVGVVVAVTVIVMVVVTGFCDSLFDGTGTSLRTILGATMSGHCTHLFHLFNKEVMMDVYATLFGWVKELQRQGTYANARRIPLRLSKKLHKSGT